MQGFSPIVRYEVCLDTDCKINTKTTENIFTNFTQNHSLHANFDLLQIHLYPLYALPNNSYFATFHTQLSNPGTQIGTIRPKNHLPALHFIDNQTFPHPHLLANPHPFPTYPQPFSTAQTSIAKPQAKPNTITDFRNTTLQNYFGFPKWFTIPAKSYPKPSILQHILIHPISKAQFPHPQAKPYPYLFYKPQITLPGYFKLPRNRVSVSRY